GLLPVEVIGKVLAFKEVAAGEAKEFGMEGGEFFHQVGTEAVGLIVPGGREEGEPGEPGGAGLRDEELDAVVGGGLEARPRFQGEEALAPGGADRREGGRGGNRS